MRPLLFNGKFLSAAPTGVHRVAAELIRAIDARLSPADNAELLVPRDADHPLPLKSIKRRRIGRLTWQAWEQADLPRLAGPGLLLNLCNLGPIWRRDAITMIHDAQVHETPSSYAPAFRAYYNAVQPMIARRHKAVLTVSEFARSSLIRHGVADNPFVIPNGGDHALREKADPLAAAGLGLRSGGYVLALARAQSHKNIATLIEAFAAPRLTDLKLALFGGDALCTIHPNPPANVVHLGRVSDRTLFSLMRTAAAYACPSRTEGFGLPVIEAMSLGCPVVAAPCGALPEIAGGAALYAHPDQPHEWAEAIDLVACRPSLRARLVQTGAKQATLYTWAGAADKLLDLVNGLDRNPTCAA